MPGYKEPTDPTATRVTRRTFLRGALALSAVVLLPELTGCHTDTAQANQSANTPPVELQPDTASAVPTSESNKGTANEVLLDPNKVRDMSTEQMLEVIRIPEEIMNDPEAIVNRYTATLASIYNCGGNIDEFNAWVKTNTTSKSYYEHVLERYYYPLLSQLWGKDVSKVPKTDPAMEQLAVYALRQQGTLLAENGALDNRQNNLNTPEVPIAKLTYTISDVQPKADGSIAFSSVCQDGITSAVADTLMNQYNMSNVNVRPTTPDKRTIYNMHYDTKHQTVVVWEK